MFLSVFLGNPDAMYRHPTVYYIQCAYQLPGYRYRRCRGLEWSWPLIFASKFRLSDEKIYKYCYHCWRVANNQIPIAPSSFKPFSMGTVFIRQDLTYKDGRRTGMKKTFIMVVGPYHRYSNAAKRAD